ncbi:hypothetical protein [Aquicella siphonis]|uniref:hypothetical protein n=1 Tax=Aquicella siphonis TaxID=254247 RepID=UPI0011DE11B6|nr:hypothetical protein [Aquicella siphonis]
MENQKKLIAQLSPEEKTALIKAMPHKLTPDIGTHLGRFLPDDRLKELALSSKQFHQFFAGALHMRLQSKLIEFASFGEQAKVRRLLERNPHFKNNQQLMLDLLLHHIAFGQQDEAEAILKANPHLLYMKGTVTDYADGPRRTFEGITAFQLALWYKDRHMWQMIMKYLPEDEAKKQLKQHQSDTNPPAYVKAHGKYFNFAPIKAAYQEFIDYANQVDWAHFEYGSAENKKLDWLWSSVAYQQLRLPVHVINEFLRPDRSLLVNDKPPNFDETTLPRGAKLSNGDRVYPLSASYRVWGSWGLARGGGTCRFKPCLWTNDEYALQVVPAPYDLAAIIRLDEVRTIEYTLLSNQLNPKPEPEHVHSLTA